MNSKLFAFALLIISSAGLHSADAGDVSVMIKNFDYSPMELPGMLGVTMAVSRKKTLSLTDTTLA